MPNGGGDCCGTCWFNEKNEGQAGYEHADTPGLDNFCTIRGLPLRVPFYTYCANHPHKNPSRIELPIGPVWEGTSDNYREIWKLSPDEEEVRQALLALLVQIEEELQLEYPAGMSLDDIVIWQLGEFREKRAVDNLQRIVGFDTDKVYKDQFKIDQTRRGTVQLAQKALEKIEGTLPLEWPNEPEDRPHPAWPPIGASPEPAVHAKRLWWKRVSLSQIFAGVGFALAAAATPLLLINGWDSTAAIIYLIAAGLVAAVIAQPMLAELVSRLRQTDFDKVMFAERGYSYPVDFEGYFLRVLAAVLVALGILGVLFSRIASIANWN